MRLITFIFIIQTSFYLQAQDVEVSYKNISECLDNCEDKRGVLSQSYLGDSLSIKLASYLNCDVHSIGVFEVNIHNDTLIIDIPGYIVVYDTVGLVLEEGETALPSYIESYCSCFFHITLKLKELATEPEYILLNGRIIE